MPGFAAYATNGTLKKTAKAHILLNIGGLLSAVVEKDFTKTELPYIIVEALLHEFVHVVEEWCGQEFDESKVEKLIKRYKKKYSR